MSIRQGRDGVPGAGGRLEGDICSFIHCSRICCCHGCNAIVCAAVNVPSWSLPLCIHYTSKVAHPLQSGTIKFLSQTASKQSPHPGLKTLCTAGLNRTSPDTIACFSLPFSWPPLQEVLTGVQSIQCQKLCFLPVQIQIHDLLFPNSIAYPPPGLSFPT